MKSEPDPGARAPVQIAPLRLSPAPESNSSGPSSGQQGSPYPKCELLPRMLARVLDLLVLGAMTALVHRAGAAAGAVYLLLADGLFRGQSLGKRLLGIKVIHVPTRKGAGARQSAIRNFPMAVLGLLAMGPASHWGLLAAASLAVLGYEAARSLLDPLGLRIGDALAHTQVVDAKVVAGSHALAGVGGHAPHSGMERMPRRVSRRAAARKPLVSSR